MYDHLTEENLLAWLLWGEAEGEGPLGQLAVAHAVLNRAAKPRWWGDSVRSVILAKNQFDGVARWPHYIAYPSHLVHPPAGGYSAIATLALGGHTLDPTGGATHFHASWAAPAWAGQLRQTAVIGRHLFYRED